MSARRFVVAHQVIGGRDKLMRIYNRILRFIQTLPPDSAYRINTEAIICSRLCIVQETENQQQIEEKINCGQMEMLVSQATSELDLVKTMMERKPWETLIENPPPDQWKWPPVLE